MADYRLLYIAQIGRCFYCDEPMPPRTHENRAMGWTRDHFKPKVAGNTLPGNVVLSCKICNESKGNSEPNEEDKAKFGIIWRRYKGMESGAC